ncbi:MAG: sulfotransferase domain-containing protein [Pseudobdellovibrionaceae bacterium]
MASKRLKIFDRPFALSMGPQRAGTSWLDRYLRTRGDICLPGDVKEVFFFDRDYERGVAHYAAHFQPEINHTLLMEISTTSFDFAEAPKRVSEVFGQDLMLLCPLRHPVTRSYSLYLHYLHYGLVSGSLQEACAQNPQIIESSRYAQHLSNWLAHYPLEKIKIVFQETLESDQENYIKHVCKALNLPFKQAPEEAKERYNVTTFSRFGLLAAIAQHAADWFRQRRMYWIINFAKALGMKKLIFGTEKPDAAKNAIPSTDKAWLEDQLKGEVEKLETLLGRKIVEWA